MIEPRKLKLNDFPIIFTFKDAATGDDIPVTQLPDLVLDRLTNLLKTEIEPEPQEITVTLDVEDPDTMTLSDFKHRPKPIIEEESEESQ